MAKIPWLSIAIASRARIFFKFPFVDNDFIRRYSSLTGWCWHFPYFKIIRVFIKIAPSNINLFKFCWLPVFFALIAPTASSTCWSWSLWSKVACLFMFLCCLWWAVPVLSILQCFPSPDRLNYQPFSIRTSLLAAPEFCAPSLFLCSDCDSILVVDFVVA